MWPVAIALNYRLASLLASKWEHPYSSTLCWLRCSLAFSLQRSAIQSIRGARSSCGHAIKTPTVVDLINVESNISPDVQLMNTNSPVIFHIFTCPSWIFGFIPVPPAVFWPHAVTCIYTNNILVRRHYTPSGKKKKRENECGEKPQKCMCMSNVF